MSEHKQKEEANEEFLELQKAEGIKLVYIQLLNKAQELAGSFKVDAYNFKHDEEASTILNEYGEHLSDFIKKMSLHVASL